MNFPKREESAGSPFSKYALVAISEPSLNAVGIVGLPESRFDAVLKFLSLNLQIVLEFENKFSG